VYVKATDKKQAKSFCQLLAETSVADPDPGSSTFLTPRSGMGKKSGSGSGMNNLDHISESLETIFWVKIPYLNSLKRIRNGKSSDPRSGINIPDPQHWPKHLFFKNN
jgi:hypothetical protein